MTDLKVRHTFTDDDYERLIQSLASSHFIVDAVKEAIAQYRDPMFKDERDWDFVQSSLERAQKHLATAASIRHKKSLQFEK